MRKRVAIWVAVGVVGIAAFVAGVLVLVFSLTSGVVDAADTFLKTVGQGQYEQAWRSTTPQFRQRTDLDAFRGEMQRAGLHKFNSASWSSRRLSGSFGRVRGTARTLANTEVPIIITMSRRDGAWLIDSVTLGPAARRTDEDD